MLSFIWEFLYINNNGETLVSYTCGFVFAEDYEFG